MTDSLFIFHVAAGVEDFLEILIPIVFVVIYVGGNIAKGINERKKKDSKSIQGLERKPASQSRIQQTAANQRAKRLPYAKAVSESQTPPQQQKKESYLQKMEELKQKRLAQLRAQQQQRQPTIQPPPVRRAPVPPSQVPAKPRPMSRPAQPVRQVRKAIPVAQPVQEPVVQVKKARPVKPKKAVTKTTISTGRQDIISMLRHPRQIKNAIVAAEILGKPISLR